MQEIWRRVKSWLKAKDWVFTVGSVIYTFFIWKIESIWACLAILVAFWIFTWICNTIRDQKPL